MIEGVALGVGTNVVGNRIDSNLFDKNGLSEAMLEALVKLDTIQRTRTVYPFNVGPTGAVNGFVSHSRFRCLYLLVSGAPGDRLGLAVSGSVLFDWLNVTGTLIQIPLPILLDNGKTIQVIDLTNPGATTFTAWLFAHTE